MTQRPRYLLPTGHAVPLAVRKLQGMQVHRVLRCAGDELMDRRVCACWPGVRRAGPRQSPARLRRAAAERSGAALIKYG